MSILLKDVIRDIDRKDHRDGNGTFSITFMTCHVTKTTGGEFISLEKAGKTGLPPNCKNHEMRSIIDLQTHKKYAVHNRLIFKYNEQEVIW